MATKRRTDTDITHERRRPGIPVVEASASDTKSGSRAPEKKTTGEPVPESRAEPAEPAEPADLERRARDLTAELQEVTSARMRLAADFENYKKRARQEQMDTMRYAAATVAERLLPVLDDGDRALGHAPEGVDESWLTGVRMTFKKLEDVLGSVGVERIEAAGLPFDPKVHEAVGSDETADQPEDTVVTVLRHGYRMHDRVLRPALVRVARPPAELPPAGTRAVPDSAEPESSEPEPAEGESEPESE
jgi:molecular chaperone GrpE